MRWNRLTRTELMIAPLQELPPCSGKCGVMTAAAFLKLVGCLVLGGGLWLGSTGCASLRAPSAVSHVFFPPPPVEPRLQFLTSYSQAEDIDPGNRWLAFLVGKAPPSQVIGKPYGLALTGSRIYVCDTGRACVDVIDLDRKSFSVFKPGGQGRLRTPINIAVDGDGTRYVADTGRHRVFRYTASGVCVGTVGETADMEPVDVLVTSNRLYVADLAGHCVYVYRKHDGHLLGTVPRDRSDPRARLFQPINLALDRQGRLYVSDAGAFCIKQYDAEGVFLREFGSHGDTPGQFARPRGVAVDRAGRLYAVDGAAQVVQIFDPEGNLLLFFGEPGASGASLNLPAKIVIDYDHVEMFRQYAAPDFEVEYVVLVTNQYGDRKVSVYGFGHRK